MAQKTMRALVMEAQSLGYNITYRTRKDGGIIVTSINGTHFRGAKGNTTLRSLLGEKISEARAIQLTNINKKVARGTLKRTKKKDLPEEIVKKLRQVQRKWRKTHKTIEGTITKSNVRWVYEKYGKEAALQALDSASRHASGLAYIANIEWFLERLEDDLKKIFIQVWKDVHDHVEIVKLVLKDADLVLLLQYLYEYEKTASSDYPRAVSAGQEAKALLLKNYPLPTTA